MKIRFFKFNNNGKDGHAAFLMATDELGYGIGVLPNEYDERFIEMDLADATQKLADHQQLLQQPEPPENKSND